MARFIHLSCNFVITFLLCGCSNDHSRTNAGFAKADLKIGLLQIEVTTVNNAVRRLNRIGADWDFVTPNLPLAELQKFDVLWMPAEWGASFGLADVKQTLDQYVQTGGSIIFMEPDVDGDAKNHSALSLLPYPVMILKRERGGSVSIAYQAEAPNPATSAAKKNDLPRAYDQFVAFDQRWIPLAWSLDKNAEQQQKLPTMLAAEMGLGRVVLLADKDDELHQNHLSDRFVTRTLKWLGGLPDSEIRKSPVRLGPRKFTSVVQRLRDDCDELLANESLDVQADLKRVEGLMSGTIKLNSTWGHQYESLELMSKHRTLATVAVGLKILSDESINDWHFREEFCQVFRLHTGHNVTDDNAAALVQKWWPENRDRLTVDMNQMTARQIEITFGELPKVVKDVELRGYERVSPISAETMLALMSQDVRSYEKRRPGLLQPELMPLLLDACRDPNQRWMMVGPLAAMFQVHQIPDLKQMVLDDSLAPGLQVVASAALHRAGQTPDYHLLKQLYDRSSQSDLRQALLVAMAAKVQRSESTEQVVAALRDAAGEIAETARLIVGQSKGDRYVNALVSQVTKRMAADRDSRTELMLLQKIVQRRPGNIRPLAGLIRDFLENWPEAESLSIAVDLFATATGQRFGDSSDLPQARAILALRWYEQR